MHMSIVFLVGESSQIRLKSGSNSWRAVMSLLLSALLLLTICTLSSSQMMVAIQTLPSSNSGKLNVN